MQNATEILKVHKYTFLKNKLSIARKEERDHILELYPKLGKGYRLKTMSTDFWEMKNKEEASAYLAFWSDQKLRVASSLFNVVYPPYKDIGMA